MQHPGKTDKQKKTNMKTKLLGKNEINVKVYCDSLVQIILIVSSRLEKKAIMLVKFQNCSYEFVSDFLGDRQFKLKKHPCKYHNVVYGNY